MLYESEFDHLPLGDLCPEGRAESDTPWHWLHGHAHPKMDGGYGLRLRGKDLHRALDILRQEDISWRKVYGFTREGRAEELAL